MTTTRRRRREFRGHSCLLRVRAAPSGILERRARLPLCEGNAAGYDNPGCDRRNQGVPPIPQLDRRNRGISRSLPPHWPQLAVLDEAQNRLDRLNSTNSRAGSPLSERTGGARPSR